MHWQRRFGTTLTQVLSVQHAISFSICNVQILCWIYKESLEGCTADNLIQLLATAQQLEFGNAAVAIVGQTGDSKTGTASEACGRFFQAVGAACGAGCGVGAAVGAA